MFDRIDPALLLARLEARRTELGELRGDGAPLSWVEVAAQVGIHSATFSRLSSAGRLPGEQTMTRILKWLGIDDPEVLVADPDADQLTVIGDTSLPVASRDHDWDGDGARRRVFEAYTDADGTVDEKQVSKAFLYRDADENPQTKGAYKMGFADVIDGSLTIVPEAVIAVATVLNGGRAGVKVSDDERASLRNKCCTLYDKVRSQIDDFPDCPLKDDPKNDGKDVDGVTFTLVGERGPELNEGGGCGCEHSVVVDADAESQAESDDRTAAIYGWGRLSESDDPETQAAVSRARELMDEGGVGVSIMHDINPDDMPAPEVIDELVEQGRWEELDELLQSLGARPRHVAIVDTPAFSDAKLTLNEDGTVEGPVVFEGRWTGDMRRLPYGMLTWDDDLLPIPIIWDRQDGDHTGMTIGIIEKLERQDGKTAALRPLEIQESEVEAVAAAAGVSKLPAAFFHKFKASKKMPLHVDAADSRGLRRIWGHAAPRGVCHRSDMQGCFQWPGDVDPSHGGFHTGASVELDDGRSIRVGALTFGGLHINTGLARQGVGVREVNRHREDANKVLAMVRVWEDQFGLALSGVIPPDVTESDLLRALSCAPSVELWPSGRGRTLVGIHIVPTPAWPVVSSAGGSSMEFTAAEPIEVEGLEVGEISEFDIEPILSRLDRIEKALALVVSDRIADDIPEPEPAE